MGDKITVEFRATAVKCVYDTYNFKIYAMDVDTNLYPGIKTNRFGNVSIKGDLPELVEGCEYKIKAVTEDDKKYGTSYRVENISRDMPTTEEGTKRFLREVLTERQADILYNAYPDIMMRVKNNNLSDIDVSKMYGIGEHTLNRIIDKICENFYLADIVSEFGGILSFSAIKKIYSRYGSADRVGEKLKDNPYTTLTEISGIGFKTADGMVKQLVKNKIVDFGYDVNKSKDRCSACMFFLLRENEKEGNTVMNLAELRRQCIDMVPECSDRFVEAIEDDEFWYDKNIMAVSLESTRYKEIAIAHAIANNVHTDDIWECDMDKYRDSGEFVLSDEQMSVIDEVCNNNISILNGSAGTGKTASTKALIRMLDDNKKKYMLMAPTGKAAKIMAEATGKHASTIHRALGYAPGNGWTYCSSLKLYTDVVIVDEFSMVDVDLFYHLIEAIDFNRTRLLMIGDSAQLPSVGCGNLFHDFIVSEAVPVTTLKKVFRYEDGGLMKVATDVRMGRKYLDKSMEGNTKTFGDNKDYSYIDMKQEKMPKAAATLYKKLILSGEDVQNVQVICCKNVSDYGTVAMNNAIQEMVNKNYGSRKKMTMNGITYYDDDLVLQCKNNYNAEIYGTEAEFDENGDVVTATVANGETGKILDVTPNYVIIDFDGIVVKYDRSEMSDVKLGYAITAHKSQGSSIDNIIVLTPKADTYMLNSNLLYVALTRMKKHCYHFGNVKTVNIAIGKKANMRRNTLMQSLIKMEKMKANNPGLAC